MCNQNRGIVFNIQRFSLHDGPGIRTVVFMKGCALRCEWCSNPESQSESIEVSYEPKLCMLCRNCERICPQGAICFGSKGFIIDKIKCSGCLACASICAAKAVKAEGFSTSIRDIVNEVMKDKAFYEGSGGGVTLSGGDPVYQPAFSAALLREFKKNGLHTSVETTGYCKFEDLESILLYTDLLLYDFKHPVSEKHFKGTGVKNELIIENLKKAEGILKEIIIRIPVIPGFNDSREDIALFLEILKGLKTKRVHLLPFHQLASRKYELIGRDYAYKRVKPYINEDLIWIKDCFCKQGFEVQIGG